MTRGKGRGATHQDGERQEDDSAQRRQPPRDHQARPNRRQHPQLHHDRRYPAAGARTHPPCDGIGAGKDAGGAPAVPRRAGDAAARHEHQQDVRRQAAVPAVEAIAEGDEGVVGLVDRDGALAGRAAEPGLGPVGGGLRLGDPAQHALLVRLEAARARVHPRRVGRVRVVLQADEADVLVVGGDGAGDDGMCGLGRAAVAGWRRHLFFWLGGREAGAGKAGSLDGDEVVAWAPSTRCRRVFCEYVVGWECVCSGRALGAPSLTLSQLSALLSR